MIKVTHKNKTVMTFGVDKNSLTPIIPIANLLASIVASIMNTEVEWTYTTPNARSHTVKPIDSLVKLFELEPGEIIQVIEAGLKHTDFDFDNLDDSAIDLIVKAGASG